MPPERKQPPPPSTTTTTTATAAAAASDPDTNAPATRPATRYTHVYPPVAPIAAPRRQSHVPVPHYPTTAQDSKKARARPPAATQAQAKPPDTNDKMRTSDLVAPEITYHVPHTHQSPGHFSSLVRPHGPSAQPPPVGSRPPPPIVTPVPPPKPPTLSSGPTPDRPLQPPPRADRNIDKVVLGDLCFRTWYPSYYGKELLGDLGSSSSNSKSGASEDAGKASSRRDRDQPVLERLYVCPSCFKYSKELVAWWGHVRVCERKGKVPGRKVYVHPQGRRKVLVPQGGPKGMGPKRKRGDSGVRYAEQTIQDEGEWSIWEVDGEKEKVS